MIIRSTSNAVFVLKKHGELRMIVDARRANCHFKQPSHSYLCTGEGLSRIELQPGESLHLASSDLKDCFNHIELPQEWQQYFGMRGIPARFLGVSEVNGVMVAPDTMIYPRLRVCPMGWSWAVFWCQTVVQRLVSTSKGNSDH